MGVKESLTHARSLFYSYLSLCVLLVLFSFKRDPRDTYERALSELQVLEHLQRLMASDPQWRTPWPSDGSCALDDATQFERDSDYLLTDPSPSEEARNCARCEVVNEPFARDFANLEATLEVLLAALQGTGGVVAVGYKLRSRTGPAIEEIGEDLEQRLKKESGEAAPTSHHDQAGRGLEIHECQVVLSEAEQSEPHTQRRANLHVSMWKSTTEELPGLPLGARVHLDLDSFLSTLVDDEEDQRAKTLEQAKRRLAAYAQDRKSFRQLALADIPDDVYRMTIERAAADLELRAEVEAAVVTVLGFQVPLFVVNAISGFLVAAGALFFVAHLGHVRKHFAKPTHAADICRFPWLGTFEHPSFAFLTGLLLVLGPLSVSLVEPLHRSVHANERWLVFTAAVWGSGAAKFEFGACVAAAVTGLYSVIFDLGAIRRVEFRAVLPAELSLQAGGLKLELQPEPKSEPEQLEFPFEPEPEHLEFPFKPEQLEFPFKPEQLEFPFGNQNWPPSRRRDQSMKLPRITPHQPGETTSPGT